MCVAQHAYVAFFSPIVAPRISNEPILLLTQLWILSIANKHDRMIQNYIWWTSIINTCTIFKPLTCIYCYNHWAQSEGFQHWLKLASRQLMESFDVNRLWHGALASWTVFHRVRIMGRNSVRL